MEPRRIDFAEFYSSSRDDCLRTVLAISGDRGLAEDLVAEAFARAWASWRTVAKHPAPRAWVVRTALNLHTSYWRRHRREVLGDRAAVTTPGGNGPPAGCGAAAGGAPPGASTVDPQLMAALAALPERQRQVVVLRIFLDLDTAGTAQALGIAPGTVTAHLARAVAALRAQLAPRSVEERQ